MKRRIQVILLLLALPLALLFAEGTSKNEALPPPLYVVDGCPTEPSALPAAEEIYSTTVLNGETGKQLFGERGSNVVFFITTKKAKGVTSASMKAEKAEQNNSHKSYDPRKDKRPIYIVDGHIGVHPDDLPPTDEIAETKKLSSKQAMEIYGERAQYGAVVIKTKEFVKSHGGGSEQIQDNKADKKKAKSPGRLGRFVRKYTGGNTLLGIIICMILVLLLMSLPTIIPILITKYKNRFKNEQSRSSTYTPGTFDAEGVVFRATDSLWFYITLAIPVISAILALVALCKMACSPNLTFSAGSVFAFVFLTALFFLLIFWAFYCFKSHKCYLTVDEDGIRGIYMKTAKKPFKSKFRNINIRWEELTDVKVICNNNNYLDFFYRRAINPYESIDLTWLPTKKVIDSINFFYARKMGISKQPALIKPIPFEKSNIFTIILILLVVALLTYLSN